LGEEGPRTGLLEGNKEETEREKGGKLQRGGEKKSIL